MDNKESQLSPGPWRVDADEEDSEFDVFDAEDYVVASVCETGDTECAKYNAYLMAHAWQMKEDIKQAIKLLRDGEDIEARKLLQATLQKAEPVESAHGRAEDGSAAPGEVGGASR